MFVVLVLVATSWPWSVRAGAYFAGHTDYATASTPEGVATGDLNGDGRLDLVAACDAADSLSLFFGKGDGTFQPRVNLVTGTRPVAVALADLNGDLKLDIVVVEKIASTFSVRLGNGDGTFGPRTTFSGPFAGPKDLALGYINGDNNLDVVLTHLEPHGYSAFLGTGDGSFESALGPYSVGGTPTGGIAVGDFNGDGHTDVAVSAGSDGILYSGNGDGMFTFLGSISAPHGLSWIATGDLNEDGKLDLVGLQSAVSVWIGNGAGSFGTRSDYPISIPMPSLTIKDLNGDGHQDLAVANGSVISIFSGNGDGTLAARAEFPSDGGPFRIISGDFNADGRFDIADVSASRSIASVLLNATTFVDASAPRTEVFLAQSEPNPARDATMIRFSLQKAGNVRLSIYDVSGRIVTTLFVGSLTPGWHAARWDRRTDSGWIAPAGIYLCELRTQRERAVRRVTLVKP